MKHLYLYWVSVIKLFCLRLTKNDKKKLLVHLKKKKKKKIIGYGL
jgi:hypothetical protein